ncbi:hypothetical protein FRX31_006484 [Thalictrum thalictroides]|uniref:Uncharacterized protein n=1 Tax=Thalictrum thalictroides TaxID=46969 RepID=A0A7J6X506_THATH|nr:hypothetical protein FRX31_006484 [Thalictrum thalictroides]
MDSHLSYKRVLEGKTHAQQRQRQRGKGFKLNQHRRFSVFRLKRRFIYLIKILSRWNWKSSCGQAIGSIKNSIISRSRSRKGTPTMDHHYGGQTEYRLRSYGRSNSFYTEAIADCLEFIKRTSVSSDDHDSVVLRYDEPRED